MMTEAIDRTDDLQRWLFVMAMLEGDTAAKSALIDWLQDHGCSQEESVAYALNVINIHKTGLSLMIQAEREERELK